MMEIGIEARYLHVDWLDQDTVAAFACSLDPLELHQDNGQWRVDAVVFNDHFSRIGFKILEQNLLHRPYFIVNENTVEELLAVVDPSTGETWWVQNSGWDGEKRRYNSHLQRTVGAATLFIQNRQLTILNHSSNFTTQELEAYLSDFKADLWWIILDSSGTVKGKLEKSVPNILGEDLFHLLLQFVEAAEQIAGSPAVELREVVAKKPIRSVKPISQTFVELASKGYARQLSSRGFVEIADTNDNRYVHHLVSRLLYVIDNLSRMALSQRGYFNQMAKLQSINADEVVSRTHKTINKEVFENEINKLADDESAACESVRAQGVGSPVRLECVYTVLLGAVYGNRQNQFFCDELDGRSFKDDHDTYLVVALPEQVATCVKKLGRQGIKVFGDYSKKAEKNKNEKTYYRLDYSRVERIELVRPTAADRMREKAAQLESLDWRMPLVSQERIELAKEAEALTARARDLELRADEMDSMREVLDAVRRRLRRILVVFQRNRVGRSSHFPNSMRFVRHPDYFTTKSTYDKIKNLAGIDENLLESMAIVSDIGLVNVSNLYEKWCLLQIIKVLRDRLGFHPEGGWKQHLVNGILNKERNLAIDFVSNEPGWSIRLTNEKALANRRRPDFVIDISLPCYERTEQQDSDGIWYQSGKKTARLVLDAKFRERWRPGEHALLVSELRCEKNYAEDDKNRVFILHPCSDLSEQRTSPLAWGAGSDYGQLADHKFGGVFLSPSHSQWPSLDNLHRLIGMVFQEEYHYLDYGEGRCWSDAACLGCGQGTDSDEIELTHKRTRSGKDRWLLSCTHCKLVSERTRCYGEDCGRTLYKNGQYWTYHRTRAEAISNVVCPSCTRFFDSSWRG